MHPKFAALADSPYPTVLKLTSCQPHTDRVRLPLDVPRCDVYLFSEGADHLYVGRTIGCGIGTGSIGQTGQ